MRRRLAGRSRPGLIPVVLLGVTALAAACGPGASPTPSPTLIPRPTPTKSAPPAGATAAPAASRAPTAAPTAAPTPAPTGQAYTVQSGDTLVAIAAKFGVTLEALRAANPQVTDPTKLKIGQVLVIPPK